LELNDFQKRAGKTDAGHAIEYYICKLTEEVGGLNKIWAKFIARNDLPLTKKEYSQIQDESGDILWCLARLNSWLKLDLDKIGKLVLKKNEERKARRK